MLSYRVTARCFGFESKVFSFLLADLSNSIFCGPLTFAFYVESSLHLEGVSENERHMTCSSLLGKSDGREIIDDTLVA